MAAKGTGDPCPCSNIVIMQLFHELKQRFPAVPDRVVSECIRQNCHDKDACERLLRRENQGYLMHSYPMALKLSVAAEDAAPAPGQPCERCSATAKSDVVVPVVSMALVPSPGGGAPQRQQPAAAASACFFSPADQVATTQTQWAPQFILPLDDLAGYQARLLGGGDSARAVPEYNYPYPQFDDVTFSSGSSCSSSAQYKHIETKQSNCSTFAQTEDTSGSSVVNSAQCVLQESHAQKVSPRQCQTRSSVSVQSSTTYHHHHHHLHHNHRRPPSLDVLSAAQFDQSPPPPQPWSAPDMPPSFEPFGQPASVTPSPPPAALSRTSLTVEPVPHYASRNYWAGPGVAAAPYQPRSYTSVNLTLRPPSLDPLPPIDIHTAGTSLTYSTSSYDPRQGYQSQLQICIGPGGVGSASALRTRAPALLPDARPRSYYGPELELREEPPTRAESLPDVTTLSLKTEETTTELLDSTTQVLLAQQRARKELLVRELKKEKKKLHEMQREVKHMENDLAQRQRRQRAANLHLTGVTSFLQKMQCLRQEIQVLQQECDKMNNQVQLTALDPLPLGETDEAFYKNIYTGQRGCVLNRHSSSNTRRHEIRVPNPPLDVLDLDEPNWTCTECTFRNHPLLDKCEQCEMPRIILGTDSKPPLSERCYCHPSSACDKMCLPNPLTPLPTMIMNKDTMQQIQN